MGSKDETKGSGAGVSDPSANRPRGEGNFGDYRYLREGVWELKVDCGPGYRVYFAVQRREILLLLIGGDKKSQKADVMLAIDYWKDHQKDKPNEQK